MQWNLDHYNELLCNEVLSKSNDIILLLQYNSKIYGFEKILYIAKPRYSEYRFCMSLGPSLCRGSIVHVFSDFTYRKGRIFPVHWSPIIERLSISRSPLAANANLYQVTEFHLYLSVIVHYFNTLISSFTQFFIHKNCFELFYLLMLRNS